MSTTPRYSTPWLRAFALWAQALSAEGNSLGDVLQTYVDKWADDLAAQSQPEAQPEPVRSAVKQYDLDQSPDYRKGYEDGRRNGYEVGKRHAAPQSELSDAIRVLSFFAGLNLTILEQPEPVALSWEQAVRSTITDPGVAERILALPDEATDEQIRAACTTSKSEPVAWIDNLGRPQPHCVTDLKYCSVMQHELKEHLSYIPLYVSPPASTTQEPEPDDYAALLRHAREILVKTGTVDVPYEQLGAGFLNVGIAPRLARDLRARFHRDDVNALMVFGTEALRRPIDGGPK